MLQNMPPGLRNLLILIGLFFLAQQALPRIGFDVLNIYLYYPDSPHFRVWQLFTHMFCHGGFTHLLFNAIALFSFGAILENRLGTKKFLYLYFISGLGAVLVHFISVGWLTFNETGAIMPIHSGIASINSHFGQQFGPYGPMLGASGALYGILIGFVFFYPNEKLVFLFIPYPIKAKILIPILLLLDIIGGLGQFAWDPIAHFAHVGGALTGYLVLKIWSHQKIKNNGQ